jgi:prophage regulatory protein
MERILVGVSEIATMLGVTRQRVTQFADTPDFPPPLADLASGRIWDGAAVELWAEAHRTTRSGRPRGGYRIEFVEISGRRKMGYVVTLEVRATDDADIDTTFQRVFDANMVGFVRERLRTARPPDQAELSLQRAMASLATRQLAREIEESRYDLSAIARLAPMTHRWFQYLPTLAQSIRHPIPDLRPNEVMHLWLNPALPIELSTSNALVEHVHMECGHWIERSRLPDEIELFSTEGRCPTCNRSCRVVGLWPQ